MSVVWITVVALCVVTAALKAVGPATIGGRGLSGRAANVVSLVAPALLAALVVYEAVLANPRGIELDARLAGLGIAALAVAWRGVAWRGVACADDRRRRALRPRHRVGPIAGLIADRRPPESVGENYGDPSADGQPVG